MTEFRLGCLSLKPENTGSGLRKHNVCRIVKKKRTNLMNLLFAEI